MRLVFLFVVAIFLIPITEAQESPKKKIYVRSVEARSLPGKIKILLKKNVYDVLYEVNRFDVLLNPPNVSYSPNLESLSTLAVSVDKQDLTITLNERELRRNLNPELSTILQARLFLYYVLLGKQQYELLERKLEKRSLERMAFLEKLLDNQMKADQKGTSFAGTLKTPEESSSKNGLDQKTAGGPRRVLRKGPPRAQVEESLPPEDTKPVKDDAQATVESKMAATPSQSPKAALLRAKKSTKRPVPEDSIVSNFELMLGYGNARGEQKNLITTTTKYEILWLNIKGEFDFKRHDSLMKGWESALSLRLGKPVFTEGYKLPVQKNFEGTTYKELAHYFLAGPKVSYDFISQPLLKGINQGIEIADYSLLWAGGTVGFRVKPSKFQFSLGYSMLVYSQTTSGNGIDGSKIDATFGFPVSKNWKLHIIGNWVSLSSQHQNKSLSIDQKEVILLLGYIF